MDSVELLKELMKIDSTSRHGANQAVEYAVAYLKDNGIEGKILENDGFKSFVAIIGCGDRTLVLNGHLDVVSGKKEQFQPVEKEGRIYGRGSADMKAGCVSIIKAFIRLKDNPPKCRLMLQLVPDEETGGKKGSAFLVEQGYTVDMVICTEPTNMKISIQSKGIIQLDVTTRGLSAHGSRPWQGVNAIEKSMENFKRITDLEILKIGSEFYESSTVNLAWIKGGDIYNRVPDQCIMGLDIRYVPHLDSQDIVSEINAVVDGDVELVNREYGVHVEPDNDYIGLLKESLLKVIPKGDVELAVQHGGSDGRYFSAKGIPAIELGPKGDFWHGDGEYVEIESMVELEEIIVDFAGRFGSY